MAGGSHLVPFFLSLSRSSTLSLFLLLQMHCLLASRLPPFTSHELVEPRNSRELRESGGRDWWKELSQEHADGDMPKAAFKPAGREIHAFVLYSAFRDSLTEFYAVGLASQTLRKVWGGPVTGCEWLPHGDPMEQRLEASVNTSTVEIISASERDEHGGEYGTIIVKCIFPSQVGGKEGGSLFLRVPRHQGNGEMHVLHDDDMLQVLHEASIDPKLYLPSQDANAKDKRLRHKYSICGAPLRSNVNTTIVREWILWHKGVLQDDVHFLLYVVEDLNQDLLDLLKTFEEEKIVTILQGKDQSSYEAWYFNQVLFINDCVHRSRHVAEWAINMDYDEFLLSNSKTQSLTSLFENHKDTGALLFNRVKYSIGYCLPMEKPGQWAMQLRPFRSKSSSCPDFEMHCHNDGRTKWAVNLRFGLQAGVHAVGKFTASAEQVLVNENDAYFIHARQIATQGRSKCSNILHNLKEYPNTIIDTTFTDQVRKLVDERHWEHVQSTTGQE